MRVSIITLVLVIASQASTLALTRVVQSGSPGPKPRLTSEISAQPFTPPKGGAPKQTRGAGSR
jgi:hypothetical protein